MEQSESNIDPADLAEYDAARLLRGNGEPAGWALVPAEAHRLGVVPGWQAGAGKNAGIYQHVAGRAGRGLDAARCAVVQ